MRGLIRFAGVVSVAALFGCASPPPPPPPTVLNVTLITTTDVNPTTDNVGAPVAIRVYQLASPTNFSGAEFFALYNSDAAVLKADLVHRDDSLMAPGTTKKQTLTPTDQVKSIGFFAAYRTLNNVTWRGTTDVVPNKTTNITVTAGHDGLVIKAEPAPPKPGS